MAVIILINKMPSYMIFDYGATHSFIAKIIAKKLGAKPNNLDEPNRVTKFSNRTLKTRTLYWDINLFIGTWQNILE